MKLIMEANDIQRGDFLKVDQMLLIPLTDELRARLEGTYKEPTSTPRPPTHVIQEGENLSLIAQRYGTTVERLMAVNNLSNPNMVRVGQELIIPPEDWHPTPTVTPTKIRMTPTATPSPTMMTRPIRWEYAAPILLAPADGAVFVGEGADILLNWASVGILGETEWYVVRIRSVTENAPRIENIWTKATSCRIPKWVHATSNGETQVFRWDVTVVQRPEEGLPIALSPASLSREFTWK